MMLDPRSVTYRLLLRAARWLPGRPYLLVDDLPDGRRRVRFGYGPLPY